MHQLLILTCIVGSASLLAACGNTKSEPVDAHQDAGETPGTGDDYDDSMLREFRAAVPREDRVRAPRPGTEPDPHALSLEGTAELAKLAVTTAASINAPAVATVVTLKALTNVPPTLYDAQKRQFVWGPFDNDEGYGKVLAYIQRNAEDADFEFTYALVRLDGNDISTAVPVIWGGATPLEEADEDGDASGVGVMLWDFEANRTFDETYDAEFSADEPVDRGRFVMLFGRQDSDTSRFKFNVAVFRNFVGEDAKNQEPANLDYFYGRYREGEDLLVDFVDWKLDADLCDEAAASCFESKSETSNATEQLVFRAAFLNRGIGRAAATVSGGDLSDAVTVDECWDDAIDRSYVQLVVNDQSIAEDGECQSPFEQTLDELDIPTLADVDADLLARLGCVAESGTACEEQ